MHILVVAQRPQESEAHRTVLCGLGHTVSTVATQAEIRQALVRGPRPEAAVFVDPCRDCVGAIRSIDGPHIYAIGALSHMSAREVKSAYAMGVDDIMSSKATSAEIAGRIDAIERIRRWVGSMGDDFALAESDPRMQLTCLQNLGEILAAEFGEMIGISMSFDALDDDKQMQCAAEIPLTVLSDNAEVTLGIGLRAEAVAPFRDRVFGGAVAHEVLADAAREFANTAAGTVKRHASDEGATLSMGLPKDQDAPNIPTGGNSWRIVGDGIEICAWLMVRDNTPQRVSASMLREGMVLSKPVKNAAGVLLVPAGSVLTTRTVCRLLEMLGPSTLVEVARAA